MSSIRNPVEFLEGAGIYIDSDDLPDSDGCQFGGGEQRGNSTTFSKPWRDTKREAAKTALFEYVRDNPSGVYIQAAVNTIFESPTESEYRLARRFYARHGDIFNSYSMGSQQWVEPRVDFYSALTCEQQSIQNKTTVQRGDGQPTGAQTEGENSELADGPQYAKDRAQSYLENYLQVQSDSVKESLCRAMIDDIEGSEDSWIGFENNVLDRYKWLPYNTRHNDGGKAGKVRHGFEHALAAATQRHNSAVMATLTTDPKQHSGLYNALQSISENKNKLLSWLGTDYQLGHRPEYICVLEFMENGLPHLHLVLFGVSYVVPQEQLAAKWRDYGQGSVVDIRQAKNRHNTDTWRLHDDDSGVVALRDYIGKAIHDLQEVANSDAEELRERVEAGDLSLWRQALYWATERQYFTCSHSLKDSSSDDIGDDGPESLAAKAGWQFVGVRQYNEIPATIKQKSTFHGRPPPATSSAKSPATTG